MYVIKYTLQDLGVIYTYIYSICPDVALFLKEYKSTGMKNMRKEILV